MTIQHMIQTDRGTDSVLVYESCTMKVLVKVSVMDCVPLKCICWSWTYEDSLKCAMLFSRVIYLVAGGNWPVCLNVNNSEANPLSDMTIFRDGDSKEVILKLNNITSSPWLYRVSGLLRRDTRELVLFLHRCTKKRSCELTGRWWQPTC